MSESNHLRQPTFSEPAVSLHERVEVGTAEWIAAANEYASSLERRDLTRDGYLLVYELTDPPPHLCLKEPFTLEFNFSSRGIRVDACTPFEHPHCHIKQDYNEYVFWVIGAALADIREHDEFAGERIHLLLRTSSVLKWTPFMQTPVIGCLRLLIAHMALRTLTNPDLDHRIDCLGLRERVEQLDRSGYTILEDAFTPETAAKMRKEAELNHSKLTEGQGFRQAMLLQRGRLWERAILHPWILTLAEHLLGRGFLAYQSDTIVKGPGLDTHPGLHADYGASRIPEPFPDYCLEATAVWAIDDFTEEAGPTVFLPGSHKRKSQVPPGMDREGTVSLEMPMGSIAFWHGASWHGAMQRTAEGTRTSLHNAYCRQFMRPIENYLNIDPAILDRNPPIFTTLCGLDDPLGKNNDNGPDFKRFRYAAENGYGNTPRVTT